METPIVRWPIHAVPVIDTAGRYPLDEQNFVTTYHHPTHALHLYEYHGRIRMGDRKFDLQPGDLTLSNAGGGAAYDLPVPGYHWCIHFYPSPVRRNYIALPQYLHLAAQRGYAVNRMMEIARLHNQGRQQLTQARAAILLQDLLLWIAGITNVKPPVRQSDAKLVQILALLDARFTELWTAPQLAETVGLTQDHLARCFRRQMGVTIPRYLLQRRIAHARQLLLTTDLPVNRIAARVGMPDPQHFNKQFRRLTGLSPTATRAS